MSEALPMVDTHVVIYAMRRPKTTDPPDLAEKIAASAALLRGLAGVRIAAVTLVEIMRGLKPEERERDEVRALFARFQVEALDNSAADLAVKLLDKRRTREKVCPRCLSSELEHECPACGRIASSQQRLNDALIAATADTRDDVPVLYTFDGGVLAFGPDVSRCRIEKPPSAFGPLFERKV